MLSNVIILTKGLSGSSVLASLIGRAGYWTGEDTVKKPDYDTFENDVLVALNRRLFEDAGYRGKYEMVFDASDFRLFEEAYGRVDARPYREFAELCAKNQPWLWKDPRLWLTIRYWQHIIDLRQVKFVCLDREPLQTWIATTLRRQIQTYEYCRRYGSSVSDSIRAFVREGGYDAIELVYEQLVTQPESTIGKLNEFLGTNLSVADLEAVYNQKLYRRPRGLADFARASLIFAKNYAHRYR